MTILSKDQILQSEDRKTKTIEVPEWGGEVIIKEMSAFDRDEFESSLAGKNGGQNLKNWRAKLAAVSIVDEKGSLLFSKDEILKLSKKSSKALNRIADAAIELNQMGDDTVEELAKN